MRVSLFSIILITWQLFSVFSQNAEFTALENAVYAQSESLVVVKNLYSIAQNKAAAIYEEGKRNVYLSQCDELLGRYHIFLEDLNAARDIFRRGISHAEKALSIEETAEAQEALVKNISQNMRCENTAYMLKHGLRLQGMIKKIYDLNEDSHWAKYFELTQNVYAPAAFANPKKGKKTADELISREKELSNGLKFNAWTAKTKAHILLKEFDEAQKALSVAEKIFPKNAEIASLKTELEAVK